MQEIAADYKSDLRFQQNAIDALQEASEIFVGNRFERSNHLAKLCKMDTVKLSHFQLAADQP